MKAKSERRKKLGRSEKRRRWTQWGIAENVWREKVAPLADLGCAICGTKTERDGRSIALDHCHKRMLFRGFLCSNCNKGIGLFGDSPERMMAAAAYLARRDAGIPVYPKRRRDRLGA